MIPWVKWSEYFSKYGLKEPKLGNHNPHAYAWGDVSSNFWQIISRDEERLVAFNQSMATLDEVLPVVGMYDFSWIGKKEWPSDKALIVDVGGGKGQALKRIMDAFPEIENKADRLVLEDRPDVIKDAERTADHQAFGKVKKVVHDFFHEQPIKGTIDMPVIILVNSD